MATLKFDGHRHQIELQDAAGVVRGQWEAFNNIDHAFAASHYHGLTHLRDGTYSVQDKLSPFAHTPDPNGPYGLYGIIRFAYPGHPGVGVHAGRAHWTRTPGPSHPTHGCIRTTDAAMLAIRGVMSKDPLQTVIVIHNSAASVKIAQSKIAQSKLGAHP